MGTAMQFDEPVVKTTTWSEEDGGKWLHLEFEDGRVQEIWATRLSPAEMYHHAMLAECRYRREQYEMKAA